MLKAAGEAFLYAERYNLRLLRKVVVDVDGFAFEIDIVLKHQGVGIHGFNGELEAVGDLSGFGTGRQFLEQECWYSILVLNAPEDGPFAGRTIAAGRNGVGAVAAACEVPLAADKTAIGCIVEYGDLKAGLGYAFKINIRYCPGAGEVYFAAAIGRRYFAGGAGGYQ